MGKISHFRQLETWQKAHKLVLMVYQATKGYPGDERSETVGRLLNGLIASTERCQ